MATSRYATVEEMKRRINKTDDADDYTLFALLEAAASAIDNLCNRPDGFVAGMVASAKYYPGNGKAYILIDECVAITEVAVKDSASDTDYMVWTTPTAMMAGDGDWIPCTGEAKAPIFERLPYTMLLVDPNGDYSHFTSGRYRARAGFRPYGDYTRSVPTVRVTARWGYAATVPRPIKEACIMQSSRWHKRLEGSMASSLATGELGTLEIYRSLDPDIELLLIKGRFVRPSTGRG